VLRRIFETSRVDRDGQAFCNELSLNTNVSQAPDGPCLFRFRFLSMNHF
jgi:hypothetical protein